jgi:hypothetical protein
MANAPAMMSSAMTAHISRRGHKVKRAERATWFLAILTGIAAIFTAALAATSFFTMVQERQASEKQLGVRTWLYVEQRSDSNELTRARKKLAHELGSLFLCLLLFPSCLRRAAC